MRAGKQPNLTNRMQVIVVIVSAHKVQGRSLKQNFISLPPVSHQQAESVTEVVRNSEGVVMNHPDIPKQNGNWSELYDKFPAEYNTTVRGTE